MSSLGGRTNISRFTEPVAIPPRFGAAAVGVPSVCLTDTFTATNGALDGTNTDLDYDFTSLPGGAGVVRSNEFALTGTGSGNAQCWLTTQDDAFDDVAVTITIVGKGSASSSGDNWEVGLHARANGAWSPTLSSPNIPSGWYAYAGGHSSGTYDRIHLGFAQEDGTARWLVKQLNTIVLVNGDVLGLTCTGHDTTLLIDASINGSSVLSINKADLITFGFSSGSIPTLEPAGLRVGSHLFANGSGGILATIVAAMSADDFEACPA